MNQASAAFSFDAEEHRYTIAGREIPACSHVLSDGGLVNFQFVREDVLERKSELGREAHKACHLYNQGKKFTCDDQIRGYFHSWTEWCERMQFRAELSEYQMIGKVNEMEYGMQIDCMGQIRAEETIVELKIGAVLPHHGLQLAGYAAGLYHATLKTPLGRFRQRKRMVVRLQEDGTLAKIHRFESMSDFDVFAAALFVSHWRKQNIKSYKEKP
jgi:hypothetical protein